MLQTERLADRKTDGLRENSISTHKHSLCVCVWGGGGGIKKTASIFKQVTIGTGDYLVVDCKGTFRDIKIKQ